jgi:uncharacterized membrane protein
MRWRDAEIETRMGRLLQAGVIAAGAIMLLGGAIYIARHGSEIADYANFHDVPPALKTVRGILGEIAALRARAIIQAGVILMIATPVFRVAFSILAFAKERDWLYTAISTIVLGLLFFALFGTG